MTELRRLVIICSFLDFYLSVYVLTKNKDPLQPFAFCSVVEKVDGMYVDCSSRSLTYIPYLPITASSVNLSCNQIQNILFVLPFTGMTTLRELDLSDNPLSSLPSNVFHGLTNLTRLYIRSSMLHEQKDLMLDILFAGLYLNILHFTFKLPEIRQFSPVPCSFRYKSQPFGSVHTLRYADVLEIDSALLQWTSNTTSDRVSFYTKSLHLINGYVCYYSIFTKQQFNYMPFIENLTIENPFLTGKATNDFLSSQTDLQHLGIYGPNAPYGFALDLIYNVTEAVSTKYKLRSLILNRISDNIRLKFHCSLGIYNVTLLNNLHTIDLSGNSLSLNTAEDCDNFPTSLQHVNLQNNCLSSYDIYNSLLFSNPKLKTVNASDQSKCSFMKAHRNDYRFNSHKRLGESEFYYGIKTFILTNSTETLFFADKFAHYDNLTYLDLSMNNKVVNTIIPQHFSSCRPAVTYLNLSECRISELENSSLSNFTELKTLDLSNNMLVLMGCNLSERLKHLPKLEKLYLGSNGISCLEKDLLDLMEDIRIIKFDNNELHNIEFSVKHASKLEYLDLSINKIQYLSVTTMTYLDVISLHHIIRLDLSGNLLLCTCGTVKFLQWMISTRVVLLNNREYTCSYSNGQVTSLKNLKQVVDALNIECTPKTFLYISISVVISCVVVGLSGLFMYRFRWKLRYLYYKTKIKIPYKPVLNGYEQIFEYDAFISYASEEDNIARDGTLNELELKRGLRTCIHQRDFQPGESIALNISKGIRSSRRTVLFISKSFLSSEWCMYELNIARMEALHTGRKVILVVQVEKIPQKELPIDVLDIIDSYTYLEFPLNGSETDLNVFWSKCADFISEI